MTEEEALMREVAKEAATIYAGMDIDTPVPYVFKRAEIPILRASERIRVVFIREHDEPQHPLPVGEVFAGVVSYLEGVPG